ncbi:MAG: family 43 glycosylhydrolase [Clostridia bacterium]|nr:family 43 glycosylhydrolase [Clostridia bacterium]
MKNPVISGWYADPESRVYNDKVYMYVTHSLPFDEQHNLDVIVSSDLVCYERVTNILDMPSFKGANFAIWAPTVIDKNGKYYIIFAANEIVEDLKRADCISAYPITPKVLSQTFLVTEDRSLTNFISERSR